MSTGKTIESPMFPRKSDPTLTEVVLAAMRAQSLGLRTSIPCSVESYNPATQQVNVKLGVLAVRYTDDGEQVTNPTIIPDCPVEIMGSDFGYLSFPLVKGDTGFLRVSDRSIEKWQQSGVPQDPGLRHTHNPIDGVFTPSKTTQAKRITPTASVIATVLEGDLIHLGAGADVEFAVLGVTFQTALTVYTATVAAAGVTHAASPKLPPDNAAFITSLVTATATLAGKLATILSAKVVVE